MILVTGAGGKTGEAVVRSLVLRGATVRALIRDPGQAVRLEQLGATEVAVEDLLSASGMARAVEGVRAIYLMAPNMHPEEARIGELAIESARSAGAERLVYHSVLHPQTRAMPHHRRKLAVEEKLLESGLDFTILQPAAYMQNVLAVWDTILSEGRYRVPYGEGGALSLVDLEDVAEVAAKVLTRGGHSDAIYELAGPEALTPAGIARTLSRSLDRPVKAERTPVPEWTEEARARGLDEYALDALARMFHHYDREGLRGNPRVLQWLLGRPPTDFSEFIARVQPPGDRQS